MSAITTHILDTGNGKPATGVPVSLDFKVDENYTRLGEGITDADGRVKTLLSNDHKFLKGIYRINFATAKYYEKLGQETFYPEASIIFEVKNIDEHFHVPLLLSGFGYSTYRGS